MKVSRKGLLAAGLAALVATAAHAAGNWSTLPQVGSPPTCIATVTGSTSFGGVTGQGQATSGSLCAQTIPAGPPFLTGAEDVPADTNIGSNGNPQTVTVPIQQLSNFSGTPRNYLDNGSLNIQQRGTGTVTCGTTSVPSTAYGPDRWGCIANVTSGAGRTAIVTTAALLPPGFAQVNTVFRTSGALTQPVCSIQEIPTAESTALAGKTVALSVYATALAGLNADNGNVITASIVTGTGSDQGLGSFTASPAITPAWTGVATPLSQSPLTITTTPGRYSLPPVSIGSAVTEIAVEFCFTPTATGAGATDGFAWVGAQLEVSPSPSPYEFHTVQADLAKAQRYFTILTEPAASVQVPVNGTATTTAICVGAYQFPVTMRAAPTFSALGTALSASTWKVLSGAANPALATTFIVTATANTVSNASLTITTAGTTLTVTGMCQLQGAGGGSILSWSADF
jgi:hypothetical protein